MWVGYGDWLQGTVDDITDLQQKLPKLPRQGNQNLLFNLDQLVFIRQLQGHRDSQCALAQLFNYIFHSGQPFVLFLLDGKLKNNSVHGTFV